MFPFLTILLPVTAAGSTKMQLLPVFRDVIVIIIVAIIIVVVISVVKLFLTQGFYLLSESPPIPPGARACGRGVLGCQLGLNHEVLRPILG